MRAGLSLSTKSYRITSLPFDVHGPLPSLARLIYRQVLGTEIIPQPCAGSCQGTSAEIKTGEPEIQDRDGYLLSTAQRRNKIRRRWIHMSYSIFTYIYTYEHTVMAVNNPRRRTVAQATPAHVYVTVLFRVAHHRPISLSNLCQGCASMFSPRY